MNHKKHMQKITAFLFTILLIYSCAKDDSQKSLPENNQNGKFTTKRVYFDEIENKEVLRQKIECFFDKNNSQGYRSKSIINNKNYILDTEKIAYIEDDPTHSYTMQLIDLDNPYKFINLLLSSSDGENYDMYRVDYNISEEEKQELIQGEYIDLNNKVRFTKIDENHFSNSYQTNSITTDEICYKIEIIESKCASGMHVHGDENCSYLGTDKEAPATFTIVITEVDCGYSGGGGGSGGGGNLPPSNPWQGNNPPSPPLGGGSGGGNIKNPPKNTTPVRNFTRFDSFYFSLMLEKPELWAWLKDTKNSEITEQIKNYIDSNSFIIGPSMQEQLNQRYEFVEEVINLFIEEGDIKQKVKNAIAGGITTTAEYTHYLFNKFSTLANNYPNSIQFINKIIDLIRNFISSNSLVNTDPLTCTFKDLFNMWLFELGNNPFIINYNHLSTSNNLNLTISQLKVQEGVNQARDIAISKIQNNDFSATNHTWTYGQEQFYDGMANGNLTTAFLESYTTKITISSNIQGYQLNFEVSNTSSWESATRFRIDNDGDGIHDGIFPNTDRNSQDDISLGGNFTQYWFWTE